MSRESAGVVSIIAGSTGVTGRGGRDTGGRGLKLSRG
jgi:hypothetical protein